VNADPEGATQRRKHGPSPQVRLVAALQAAQIILDTAEHVRARGKPLEIARSELIRAISSNERVVPLRPSLARVGIPSASKLFHECHRP
jgi:hypothetical protein